MTRKKKTGRIVIDYEGDVYLMFLEEKASGIFVTDDVDFLSRMLKIE